MSIIQAGDLTPENKQDYLRLIHEGMNPAEAARHVGSTGTQFRRLLNPIGTHYDFDFAVAYRDAMLSEAHEKNRLEIIRDLVWEKARNGDTRMIEKLALIYDPDWATLRHQNFNLNVNMVARMLPHISTAELERALAELEAEKNVVEGEVRQLPKPEAA